MERLLADKHFRKMFRIIVLLLTAVLVLLRIFVGPKLPDCAITAVVNSIADNLISGLFVTYLIAEFLFFVELAREEHNSTRILIAGEITPALSATLSSTHSWYFKGGTGRFIRSQVLDGLASAARSQSSTRHMRVCLLDVRSQHAVDAYASYRSGVHSATVEGGWDSNRVKREVATTIVRLLSKASTEPLLEVTIALSTTFSTFRYDASDSLAVVTREDPRDPAIAVSQGTRLFAAIRDEVQLSVNSGYLLAKLNKPVPLDRLSGKQVHEVLRDAGLPDLQFSDADLESIAVEARNARNPYV